MDTLEKKKVKSGSGILGLSACVLLATVNSIVFAVSNGRHNHPTAQIDDWGIVGNLIAITGAWIVFNRGRRDGLIQSLVAVVLLTILHYFLVSNLWTMIAHRT